MRTPLGAVHCVGSITPWGSYASARSCAQEVPLTSADGAVVYLPTLTTAALLAARALGESWNPIATQDLQPATA